MLRMSPVSGRLLAAWATLVFGTSGLAAAQASAPPSAAAPRTAAEDRIRTAVLARFRALPVQNGVVLVPLRHVAGVDNVELREGTIAIDGRVVTGGEVRQRLGRDADVVLELSYFDPSSQQRVLLGTAAGPPPATAGPAEPERPQEPEAVRPERPRRFRGEERVRLGGDITVEDDEEIDGPVVAIGGSIRIDGRVRDEVVSVGGSVSLGPHAEVGGDVTLIGGSLTRAPGAEVRGRVNEVAFGLPTFHIRPLNDWSVRFVPWFGGGPWHALRLLVTLLRMAVFALLAMLVLLLAPRAVDRVGSVVFGRPWKAALVGLLTELLFLPLLVIVTVLLAVSIIGIPLLVLIPFAVLAFFVALLLGFTGTAGVVARIGQDRVGWSRTGSYAQLAVGLVLIWGITVVGRMISLGGGPLVFVGAILAVIGFLVEYAAWTVGLGGAVLTWMSRHEAVPAVALPVPPGPIPPESGSPAATRL